MNQWQGRPRPDHKMCLQEREYQSVQCGAADRGEEQWLIQHLSKMRMSIIAIGYGPA